MIAKKDISQLSQSLINSCGKGFEIKSLVPVSGGDINMTYKIQTTSREYFIKVNDIQYEDMFSSEAKALKEIHDTNTINVPDIIAVGVSKTQAWILLSYEQIKNQGNEKLLGEQLAKLHSIKQNFFGWHRNNTIGTTMQINHKKKEWHVFFWENRISPMLEKWMLQLEVLSKQKVSLLKTLNDKLLSSVECYPSMLHGDLWHGNKGYLPSGVPIIFDPALYYGHHETDIAMTKLFGGFSTQFYDSYYYYFPKQKGYEQRFKMYNLYHLLNHALLFRGGYVSQCKAYFSEIIRFL